MTRRFWPEGPAWARKDAPPSPSWVGFPEVPGITKPRELAELLGRELDLIPWRPRRRCAVAAELPAGSGQAL